ncbi:hypothetical protein [Brevibacillus fortis]
MKKKKSNSKKFKKVKGQLVQYQYPSPEPICVWRCDEDGDCGWYCPIE